MDVTRISDFDLQIIMIWLLDAELMVVWGGMGNLIKEFLQSKIREDLSMFNEHLFESLIVESEYQTINK